MITRSVLSFALVFSLACGDDDVPTDVGVDLAVDLGVDASENDASENDATTEDQSLPDIGGDMSGDATLVEDMGVDMSIDATGSDADVAVQPSGFDDEFDANSLATWQRRHEVEGTAAQYGLLDVNATRPGHLVIEPTRTPGWFADGDAPLLFKIVTGDFAVETMVITESVSDPGQPPGSDFNSAGLMVRNPAGANGPENHVMVNVGRQDGRAGSSRIGSEAKTTEDSDSTLMVQPGVPSGRLILCRVGDVVSAFRRLEGEASFTRIARYTRTDLPGTVQVGMVANGYSGPDIRASFDYVRLRVPTSEADCTP